MWLMSAEVYCRLASAGSWSLDFFYSSEASLVFACIVFMCVLVSALEGGISPITSYNTDTKVIATFDYLSDPK